MIYANRFTTIAVFLAMNEIIGQDVQSKKEGRRGNTAKTLVYSFFKFSCMKIKQTKQSVDWRSDSS